MRLVKENNNKILLTANIVLEEHDDPSAWLSTQAGSQ